MSDAATALSLPVAELAPHPALARVALVPEVAAWQAANHHGDPARKERAEEQAADWAAWVAEVAAHGIREPLRVVRVADPGEGEPAWLVIDGRHRLAAAEAAGLETVPCREADAAELPAVAEGSVTGRRHWTKGQRAFFAVMLHPQVADEEDAKIRQKAKLKAGDSRSALNAERGTKEGQVADDTLSATDLAARFGVSKRLIEDAIWLYRAFASNPIARDRVEPSLWAGASLAGCRQGVAALEDGRTGPGKERPEPSGLSLLTRYRGEHALAAKTFATLTDDQRDLLTLRYRESLADAPPAYLRWQHIQLTAALNELEEAEAETGEEAAR